MNLVRSFCWGQKKSKCPELPDFLLKFSLKMGFLWPFMAVFCLKVAGDFALTRGF